MREIIGLVALAALLSGCATYRHVEKFDEAGNMIYYKTTIRTLGTNTVEAITGLSEEAASVTGIGISDNMRGVIGDDTGGKALKSFTPGGAAVGVAEGLGGTLDDEDDEP